MEVVSRPAGDDAGHEISVLTFHTRHTHTRMSDTQIDHTIRDICIGIPHLKNTVSHWEIFHLLTGQSNISKVLFFFKCNNILSLVVPFQTQFSQQCV